MVKKPDYDLIIVGGGPAGLTAGLYAARARLNVILLDKFVAGGQVLTIDWIENYPGFPEGINGFELAQNMLAQAKRFGLKIENEEVKEINFQDPIKILKTEKQTFSAYAVIIATGASFNKLGVPGEDLYFGKGLSCCATCDGPFYKDKIVAAVGGGDTAVQESLFLTKFAKKVYLIHRRDQLRATKILQERLFENAKIELCFNSIVTHIHGKEHLEALSLKNLKTNLTEELKVDGCFIWIGINPNTEFLKQSLKLDALGAIIVDDKMTTSIAGIFAAGDVRSTSLRQITTSVGDGAIAANSAMHYLENLIKV